MSLKSEPASEPLYILVIVTSTCGPERSTLYMPASVLVQEYLA